MSDFEFKVRALGGTKIEGSSVNYFGALLVAEVLQRRTGATYEIVDSSESVLARFDALGAEEL